MRQQAVSRSRRGRILYRGRAYAARSFCVLSFLICVAVTSVAIVRSPAMVVRRVEVHVTGLIEPHEARATRSAARLAESTTITGRGLVDVARRTRRLPWVYDVQVKRDLVHRIVRLYVQTRQPSAAVDSADGKWEVDAEGWVIRPLRRGQNLRRISVADPVHLAPGMQINHPLIKEGLAAAMLSSVIDPLRESRIHVDQTLGICFNNPDEVLVVLGGPDDLLHKLAVVDRVYALQPEIGRDLAQIDVTSPRYPLGFRRDSHNPKKRHQPPT